MNENNKIDNKIDNKLIKKIYNKYIKNKKVNIKIDEIFNILDLICNLFVDYIKYNGLAMHEPNFHSNINNEIFELIKIQLAEINFDKNELAKLVEIAEILIFKYIYPKRSYNDNSKIFIKSNIKINKLKNNLIYLKNVYQPEQRTDEWYKFRHNVITASNIWKAFHTENSFNRIVIEKSKPINIDKYNIINEGSPMHWGQKYEFVSVQYYEYIYNTTVDEFGCIPHKDYAYLAASPDGINTKENSRLYGRMLEIKNIFNRKINGIPKLEYWIQMQIQMEVCDLNECDFLETRFLEYDNHDDFINDYYVEVDLCGNFKNNLMMTKDLKYKGMIIGFIKDGRPYYEYSPFNCSYDELLSWEININEKNENLEFFKNIYYRLDEISCVLVLRNKHWFNSALIVKQELWENINLVKNNNTLLNELENKNKKNIVKNIKVNKKCFIDNHLFNDKEENNDKVENKDDDKGENKDKGDNKDKVENKDKGENKDDDNGNLLKLDISNKVINLNLNKSISKNIINRKRKNNSHCYITIDT